MYGSKSSYFTGTLATFLRDKGIPDVFRSISDAANRRIRTSVGVFADEWLWRPAMHYRWGYPEARFTRGTRLGLEMAEGGDRFFPRPAPRTLIQQRQIGTFVRGGGIEPTTRAHVDQAYHHPGGEASVRRVSRVIPDELSVPATALHRRSLPGSG